MIGAFSHGTKRGRFLVIQTNARKARLLSTRYPLAAAEPDAALRAIVQTKNWVN